MYDFLVVGAGLFGSVFAHEAISRGKSVLVVEAREHIGGNCYSEIHDGIVCHVYGAHIFHTHDAGIWRYMTQFAEFLPCPPHAKASAGGRMFSFPINLMTMQQVWGVTTPAEAERKLAEVRIPCDQPRNVEEWALSQIGRELYELFIAGYTAKQWARDPKDLPASIVRRIPIHLNFSERFFSEGDRYVGIPVGGYTPIFEQLLAGGEVLLGTDFFVDRALLARICSQIVYTGGIDRFFDYCYGSLEYRTLRFEHERFAGDHQGTAVVNHCDLAVPYTRTIEHKHFEGLTLPHTVLSREYPAENTGFTEPYYPVIDEKNRAVYARYKALAESASVIFGGRLASFQYYDMHHVVAQAISVARKLFDGLEGPRASN